MDVSFIQQIRAVPKTGYQTNTGLLLLIGILALLTGLAFLLKTINILQLPIPVDDKIFQYATSIFSIIGGLYMIYKAFWRPRLYL